MADLKNPPPPIQINTLGPSTERAALTRWQRLRPHLLALAFYSLLTLLVVWPVVLQLGVGTPGHFPTDRNQNLWNMWWFRRAVFGLHNPYHTDFLFFPYGADLYLHTFSLYNQLVGLPLQLLFGPVPAYSLLELLTFPLGGYAGWLLGHYLTGNQWGALLVGLVWSFGPYHWVELRQDQINLVSLQWLPIVILFILKLDKATTRPALIRYTLLAALFYFLTLLVDYYYAIYLLMFAALYWLWRVSGWLWQYRRDWRQVVRPAGGLTAKLAAAFGLGMLPYSPLLLATIRETGNPRYEALQNADGDQLHSTDLAQLFLPPSHQPWWGEPAGFWQNLVHPTEGATALNNWGAVLGYVAVALSIYALWKVRGRGLGLWVFTGFFWLIISFGPSLRINGPKPGWPMPYRLLTKLPFIGIGRFPERFMLMAQLSIGLLAAFGLAHLLDRWSPGVRLARRVPVRSLVGSLVLALFFLESWPGVLPPPDPITPPAFTTALLNPAQTVAGPAILELPVTKHSNPDSPRMLYQTYHSLPITGGYISRKLLDPDRTPPYPDWYDWVELLTPVTPDVVPALSQSDRRGILTQSGLGFVVVYPGEFQGDTARLQRLQTLLDLTFAAVSGQAAKPAYQDDLAQVYAVPPTPLTHPILLLGQGWDAPEGIGGGRVQRWVSAAAEQADLKIIVNRNSPATQSFTLQMQLVSPDKPRHLQIRLNGQLNQSVTVSGVTSFKLANLPLSPGDNIISLRPDPSEGFFSPPNDNRRLRIGILSITLTQ